MKFNFLHRALSIFLVIVFLLSGFILLSNTQDILANLETEPEKSLTVKFIILFLAGFSLFILNLFRPKKEVVIEKLIKNETSVSTSDKKETINTESELKLLSDEELNKEAEEFFPKDGVDDLQGYTEKLLTNISKKHEISQGVIFFRDNTDDIFKVSGKYAYFSDEPPQDFKEGESLPGQVAKNKQLVNIEDIPEGYVKVISGLGTGSPNHLLIVPAIQNEKTVAIVEIASFKTLDKNFENLLQVIANKLVDKTNKVSEE